MKPAPFSKQAWHFVSTTLRDGSPIPKDGVWLEHNGRIVMCESGLHASREPFDALQFAPGPVLCLVECRAGWIGGADTGIPRTWQEIIEDKEKLVCPARRIVARMDATEMLRYFARMKALSVMHLWDTCPPDVVLDFLATGDESIRAAARDAAMDVARAAARDAAMAASSAASRDAAWGAAIAAAMDAAWDAARDAARAARAAARDAAMAAARDASSAAARDAARDASSAAARDAARDAARNEFNQLVYECFEDFA